MRPCLGCNQVCIDTVSGEKGLMVPFFHQHASVQNQDAICIANGAQSMGNHQGRRLGHHCIQSLLNRFLIRGIQMTGGFVQNDDLGLGEERSSNGDTLTLTSRQFDACSPTELSYWSGRASMNVSNWAIRAADRISSNEASFRPYRNILGKGSRKQDGVLMHHRNSPRSESSESA